jgi:hypothetical protein
MMSCVIGQMNSSGTWSESGGLIVIKVKGAGRTSTLLGFTMDTVREVGM